MLPRFAQKRKNINIIIFILLRLNNETPFYHWDDRGGFEMFEFITSLAGGDVSPYYDEYIDSRYR
ncbi:MAG: hypothetical protein ACJAUP_001364 [Cellvibrionaceae bacterium]|jgi:hypothetical protein